MLTSLNQAQGQQSPITWVPDTAGNFTLTVVDNSTTAPVYSPEFVVQEKGVEASVGLGPSTLVRTKSMFIVLDLKLRVSSSS